MLFLQGYVPVITYPLLDVSTFARCRSGLYFQRYGSPSLPVDSQRANQTTPDKLSQLPTDLLPHSKTSVPIQLIVARPSYRHYSEF